MPENRIGAEHDSALDVDEQLLTRVAWYYYVGHLTQQQIADRLNTHRGRINRLLAAGRETGIVRIRIDSPLADCVALEAGLVARYGLRQAVVVPAPDNADKHRVALGLGAGRYLTAALRDGQTVGIGWGQTLEHTLRALEARTYRAMSVVSLQGGLSRCPILNTFEIVFDFANRLSADCYYFAAPIYAENEAARDLLLAQSAIRETYDRARRADIAVLTAGNMVDSLVVNHGLHDPQDVTDLRAAGAVGDLLGHFIDAHGARVAHPVNDRTTAVGLEDLRALDHVVLISGGRGKFEVTRAALRGGYANVLITDEHNARQILDAP
ncbi:sugar-binding transcriptional regulator [Salinisphaera hydrothermalis]|uniref:sugar-binding transcriptional regulator n=1 Tax=Salinisphaera hydrothermalis TaxID=563188 RepID=UPI00334215B6